MHKNLNESRTPKWKGSNDLTYVQSGKDTLIEYKDRYYKKNEICEALGCAESDLKFATAKDILYIIENDLVDSDGMIYEGGRYDWNHIDPITGMPKIKNRPEDKIELMSRCPNRSCWIYMLQNRVNLQSVGNMRFKAKVWFDRRDCTVSSDQTKEDAVYFREYRLSDGSYPHGWILPENLNAR